jgi:hypothetical protein
MSNIYGVDTEKPFGTKEVRNAIIRCFKQAHQKVLEQSLLGSLDLTKEEKERLGQLQVEVLVRKIFEDNQGDFENPTKEQLVQVCDELKEFSTHFRALEIINKHYEEIMGLINRLPE